MVKSVKIASTPTMSPEDFVLRAIDACKKMNKKKGVTSWKLNPAFREYFGAEVDPVATATQLRKSGKIAVFLNKGGASFYLREDLMESTLTKHDANWATRDAEPPVKTEKKPPSPSDLLQMILKGDN